VLVAPPFLAGPDDALYPAAERDAHRMVPRDLADERRRDWALTASPGGPGADLLEDELERLARLKARQELEEVYGLPIVVRRARPAPAAAAHARRSKSRCS
jgi:hypothetical protein